MGKRYIIKIYKEDYRARYITGKDLSYLIRPYYLSEIHAGYTNENDHTASFSYKTTISIEYAMIFNSKEEVTMAWNFINMCNKIHNKFYKLEMELVGEYNG